MNGGFLVTFSYCETTKTCLKDAWNYFTRQCPEGWKKGRDYDIGICNPEEIQCPSFKSAVDKY